MQSKTTVRTSLALLSALLFGVAACNSNANQISEYETQDGAVLVDTVSETATVVAIDPGTRQVTLRTEAGQLKQVTCTPAVVNFDQIRVSDQVRVTSTVELAVNLKTAGAPFAAAESSVRLAPIGGMPGALAAKTTTVSAMVAAVDAQGHRVTLAMPNGTPRTISVRPDLDLSSVQVGASVTIQVAESLAISLERG